MATSLPESTYAVLGLVDKLPGSSGYDLVAVADRSFAHFWPISQTLLYRELNRLAELGWVSATRVEQTRSPGKWIYECTPSGRGAMAGWLAAPVEHAGTFRSGFLLRFFFAHLMSPAQVRSVLADYRTALTTQRDAFSVLIDKLSTRPTPSTNIGRLAALHGLRTAEGRLLWVAEAEAELGIEPTA